MAWSLPNQVRGCNACIAAATAKGLQFKENSTTIRQQGKERLQIMISRLQSLSDGAWAHFRFFRLWLQKPRQLGAILPSSPALAQAMASRIDPHAPGAVIEFGGGTGSITQALLRSGIGPQALFVIEREAALCSVLQSRWPSLLAFLRRRARGQAIGRPGRRRARKAGCGLPLLSMDLKLRREILRCGFRRVGTDGVFVQFTYGPKSSIPEPVVPALGHRGAARETSACWAMLRNSSPAIYSIAR